MNKSQLRKMDVPEEAIANVLVGIQAAAKTGDLRKMKIKQLLPEILAAPEEYFDHIYFGDFARDVVEDRKFAPIEPIDYQTWGDNIDDGAHKQMQNACGIPSARGAAMMPDAHLGYGLPIGGVLALEDAIIPYAVGADIACRMKMSILDIPVEKMTNQSDPFKTALQKGTRFGVGVAHEIPQDHNVMDSDWNITRTTRENKDKAWKQLGTSGSGNHFVEFGLFTINQRDDELNLDAGQYVALMSHSGSRGTGASVCSTYNRIARARLPKRYEQFSRLAWLEMNSQEGQEYWAAMNLMGEYAAANHDVIHRLVSKLVGAQIISGIENHHNFAWKEIHNGKELIVHRKGATPASKGELGVIPGSMADPAFIVRGKGNIASFRSASHGAGRCMSRTKAKEKFTWKAIKNDLAKKGIEVLSAGADEVPGVYKNIEEVMQQQSDLVETVARFDPKIVKMCGDDSRAED